MCITNHRETIEFGIPAPNQWDGCLILTIGLTEGEYEEIVIIGKVEMDELTMFGGVGYAGGHLIPVRRRLQGICKGYIVTSGISGAGGVGRSKGRDKNASGVDSKSAGAQDCENEGVGIHLSRSSG